MPPSRQPIPANWASYERGGRDASTGSSRMSEQRVTWDEESRDRSGSREPRQLRPSSVQEHQEQELRHRRSSMAMRVQSLRQAGGVNSLDNFAASWQRAAGFHEIAPVRQSFRYADEEDQEDEEDGNKDSRTLVREALTAETGGESHAVFEDEDEERPRSTSRTVSHDLGHEHADSGAPSERASLLRPPKRSYHGHDDSIISIEPQLGSQFGGSYGSVYPRALVSFAAMLITLRSNLGLASFTGQRALDATCRTSVQEDDGNVVNVVVGQSTLPQTIFNSVNVLIGVGLLALPLAMKLAGWVPGLIFFAFAGISTSYTAKLLAKCADVDTSLITFADLAFVSFGPWARVTTSILFSLELIAACVALVVLFADSLDALIPGWGLTEWKIHPRDPFMLWHGAGHLHRRIGQTHLPGQSSRTSQDSPLPNELDDPADCLWYHDESMGRPQRISQHLP
nr:vacuolar amino acid transporter 1 [Quercus suber]